MCRMSASAVSRQFLVLILITAGLSRATAASAFLEPPCEIGIVAPEAQIAPGAAVTLQGGVRVDVAFAQVDIHLSTAGAVTLSGSSFLSLGPLAEGDSVGFLIPVQFSGPDTAMITVTVRAFDGIEFVENSQTLSVVYWSGRPLTGMNGTFNLALRGLEEDVLAGLLTPGRADTVADSLAAPDFAYIALPDTTAVPVDTTDVPDPEASAGFPPSRLNGDVTFQGSVEYEDEDGNVHGVYGATVEVWDHETVGDNRRVGVKVTDKDGKYSITLNNDDGFGGGRLDTYFRLVTANSYAKVVAANDRRYVWDNESERTNNIPDGTYTRNFVVPRTRLNPAWGMLSAATHAAAYARKLNGNTALPLATVVWPTNAKGTANKYDRAEKKIHVRDGHQWEWDMIMHEYGHHAQHEFGLHASPGGTHTLNKTCLSNANASKKNGTRLAWAEGWATFFSISAQKERNLAAWHIPRVGDTEYHSKKSGVRYDLEARDRPYKSEGEDNELAISRALWDLYDTVDDGLDTITISDTTLLTKFKTAAATSLSAAWATVRDAASLTNDFKVADVAAEHVIAPTPSHPPDASVLVVGSTLFWNANVGCDDPYRGNKFQLVFYKPSPLTRIHVLNDSVASHTLTEAEMQTLLGLAGPDRKVLWAVEGNHRGDPATGPYLGSRRSATLDMPVPVLVHDLELRSRDDGFELRWTLTPESDAARIDIERSAADADDFLRVATLAGDPGPRSFVDGGVVPGEEYAYRLRITTRDGAVVEAGRIVAGYLPPVMPLRVTGPDPNPARAYARFQIDSGRETTASIGIFNVSGGRVRTLLDGPVPSGRNDLEWDGRDDLGRSSPAGLYFLRVDSGGRVGVRRVLLAR